MTRPTKTWLTAVAVFLAYLLVALILALLLRPHGRSLWVMVIALAVLGLISAGLVLWFLRDHLRTPKPGTTAGSIDATLAAAKAQLAAARHVTKPNFGALPILLVLGPDASTKTTTIIRSGLEPELLAGDVYRGETVAPTEGINLWYAHSTVVVDTGGPLTNDPPAWLRLTAAIRPRSLASALTGKPQPPRLAVVCFACDEFYKPGSGETVPAAARTIRSRLGEAARQFGVQLPTYVVFTKLDAVPHFEAFTRNFSADEAREPLGAAIRPDDGATGTYADRVTPRLDRALEDLFVSLAERRLAVLNREHGAEWKPAAYEFPREFRKLAPLAIDFLREIGRPSELQVSPVLRGFYFAGVQAVFVTDTAPDQVASAQAEPDRASAASSATAVFSALATPKAPAARAAAAGVPTTRKVPRWDFLPRVIREVVFGDAAAVRLTSAGARVGFWRRLGLGSAAVVAVLLIIAFMVSYSGNRRLERDAIDATRGIAALAPNPVDIPAADPLRRLDALRTQVDTLSEYEHNGAPTSLRWGLYTGTRLYPEVRAAYFGGFNKLMFSSTRTSMLTTLRALPDAPRPTDDYSDWYSLLKAYIITTSHPEKSTTEFLTPALMHRWLGGRSIDATRDTLARRQFDTYATELRYANPFPDSADAPVVARARSFLRQFAGSERIYQFMLAEASKANPSVEFNKKFPGSSAYLVDSYVVPGAFTKGGAAFMLTAFKTVDKYLKGESWVVGDDAAQVDKAKLVAALQGQYSTEYAEHWRKFLRSASVAHYSNIKDAAAKLAVLSGNQSPLLELFSTVSQNTNVTELPDVVKIFQPPQVLTPPAVTDKLVGPGNDKYIGALLTLQSSLDQAANKTGPDAVTAAGQASNDAGTAKTAARTIASSFTIDPQGGVHTTVQSLLEAPITNAEPMLKNFGATEINVRSRVFCSAAQRVLAKFPFNADATQQASLAEVAGLLKPGSGTLWKFYDDALATALQKQGNQYVPAGSVKVRPGFVTFMNRAQAFADVMFKDNSAEPHLSFQVAPIPTEAFSTVAVSLDGDLLKSTLTGNQASGRIDWPGAGHEAKLSAGFGSTEATVAGPFTGPWAVFQLFAQADEWKTVPNGYRVGWEVGTRGQRATLAGGGSARVIVQVTDPIAGITPSMLRKGFFAGSECAGDIAQ